MRYRRLPELVEARQATERETIPPREEGFDAIEVAPGDWVVQGLDNLPMVISDEQFRLMFDAEAHPEDQERPVG